MFLGIIWNECIIENLKLNVNLQLWKKIYVLTTKMYIWNDQERDGNLQLKIRK